MSRAGGVPERLGGPDGPEPAGEARGAGWAGALDAFEARLDEQAALLDAGDAGDIPPFVPPAGLGPCPPALVERAGRLLGRALELEARLMAALTLTGRDLAAAHRAVATRPAGQRDQPRYLDQAL